MTRFTRAARRVEWVGTASFSFATVTIAGLGALLWPTRAHAEPPPPPPSTGFPIDEPPAANAPATQPPNPGPKAASGDAPTPAPSPAAPGSESSQAARAEAWDSKKPEPRTSTAAAPRRLFGEKAQLVFKSDLELSIHHVTGEPTNFGVVIRPSVDYFVTNGLSLGLALNFSHELQTEDIAGLSDVDRLETTTDSYGIGFNAGGNVRLSELFRLGPGVSRRLP